MDATELLSFVCAATAAFGNAVANVMQRRASLEQDPGHEFGLPILAKLVRSKIWLIGFSAMVASFLLQAVALGLGQLSAVEPIITLEVPLTLLVAGRVFNAPLGRLEWGAIFAMTGGMIVFVASLDPQPGDEADVSHFTYLVAGTATTATILALIIAGNRGGRTWRAACLGAATGTCFGFTATLIKETVEQLSSNGVVGVVTTWQTYAAIGFGLLGVVVMQWALHTGPLLASQPGFTLMDPIVSVLWGVLVYNETTRTGGWLVLATAGMLVLGVGVVVLARSPLLAAVNEDTGTIPHGSVDSLLHHPGEATAR
ncbi:MAG TPA: DMT family transporter [Jatrophihabitantaceae bacterium]